MKKNVWMVIGLCGVSALSSEQRSLREENDIGLSQTTIQKNDVNIEQDSPIDTTEYGMDGMDFFQQKKSHSSKVGSNQENDSIVSALYDKDFAQRDAQKIEAKYMDKHGLSKTSEENDWLVTKSLVDQDIGMSGKMTVSDIGLSQTITQKNDLSILSEESSLLTTKMLGEQELDKSDIDIEIRTMQLRDSLSSTTLENSHSFHHWQDYSPRDHKAAVEVRDNLKEDKRSFFCCWKKKKTKYMPEISEYRL
jgi:hypothetical protein